MSNSRYSRQQATGRRSLREMTVPAATAYVLLTVLTLALRSVSVVVGLVADVTERIADAGDTARAVARGPVLINAPSAGFAGPRAAAGGAR